jgi:hypothetical protein
MPVGTMGVLVNLDMNITPLLGVPRNSVLERVPSIKITNFHASLLRIFFTNFN